MKCCVASCNSSKNSQNVTFHKFPKEKFCRAAWVAALGIDEHDISENSLVCSLHFKDSNFYNGKNGSRVVQRGAVPFVQVCMICLDTNCKLYPLSKYNLEQPYETLTGLYLQQAVPYLTPAVCSECAQRLTNCSQFRHKSLRAHVLLLQLYKQHELLTVPTVKTINRQEHGLISKITQKLFKPNHCDLNVIGDSSVEVELEHVETKSVVKLEKQDEIVIAFEPKDKCLNSDSTELATYTIKNDFNDDIDIDVDFLNDENDSEFINNDENDDEDGEFLIKSSNNDKEINTKTVSENVVEVLDDNNEELSKIVTNNTKRTRKANSTANKTVRKKAQTAKRNVTKTVDGQKTKKAPKSKVKSENNKKTVRKPREQLTIFDTTKLTLEQQIEEINKRKESSNYKNSSFQCDLCYRGFVSETTYTRHMDKHSKSYGSLECPVCKQYVKDKYVLHKHSTAHSTRYNCTLCEFTAMTNESARMHEQWHKGTKYKCEHCDTEFLKYTSYITHLRVKHPSDHICSQCGYSYLSDMGLRAHLRRIHRSDKVEEPGGPACEECGVRFATDAAYQQHLKVSPKHYTPETRQVNQPVPRRSYKKGNRLHKRQPGDPEDCVTCEQCGVELKDYLRYTFHFKREHPDKNRTQFAPSKRAVLCEQCGKSFQSPHHLKYHMAKHTGQKDFQCDVCEKRFRIKAFLDKHKETHMAMAVRRLYKCAVCDKGFTCPSSLNRHIWIHRGKSFKCEICEKAFSNASERNCHVSHVHMKVPWPKRQRGPNNRNRLTALTKDETYDE